MTVGHERVERRKFSVPPEGNIRKRGAGCNEENEDSEERVSRVGLLVSWVADKACVSGISTASAGHQSAVLLDAVRPNRALFSGPRVPGAGD